MKIGNLDLSKEILLVAEIGNNHEGNLHAARALVQAAADCGVRAVKFQTFRTEHYVSQADVTRFQRLKSFELTPEQFADLSHLAHDLGILFISTPFDLRSVEVLFPLVDSFKIASGDNNFYPLIDQIAQTAKPVIISSGVSDFSQIEQTVAYIHKAWQRNRHEGELAVLHCVSSYPVPPEQANLRSIPFLIERLSCTIGYSDHTIGVDAGPIAVALGARIIEKHFTLDKHYSDFRDHRVSADPPEMRELVRRIDVVTAMLGTYGKSVQPCEEPMVSLTRRSIAAARDLPAGHRLDWSDLTWIRPSGALPPGQERELIGKTLKAPVRFGDFLRTSDVR